MPRRPVPAPILLHRLGTPDPVLHRPHPPSASSIAAPILPPPREPRHAVLLPPSPGEPRRPCSSSAGELRRLLLPPPLSCAGPVLPPSASRGAASLLPSPHSSLTLCRSRAHPAKRGRHGGAPPRTGGWCEQPPQPVFFRFHLANSSKSKQWF